MAEGKLRPNYKGQYIVGKEQSGGTVREPTIQFVTPIAQAVELAKSELKEVYKGRSEKTQDTNIKTGTKRPVKSKIKNTKKRSKIHFKDQLS